MPLEQQAQVRRRRESSPTRLPRHLQDRRGEVHPPGLDDPPFVNVAFDDLVAHQREYPSAHEGRSRVAVPVNARGAAAVVALVGRRGQLERPQLAERQRAIAQEEQCRRSLARLARRRLAAADDRQADEAVESMAS
ncbi:MAG: hypothetical protein V9F46_14705 [Chitinophagaceae bacterium]